MPYELVSDGQTCATRRPQVFAQPARPRRPRRAARTRPQPASASLKIEGRLKTPEYVANITRVYRRALDALVESRSAERLQRTSARYDLEMAFLARPLHTGWFRGINNQEG